ncbi:hypothetical protein PCE1_000587 [Barthelona sp. PCE]
MYISTLTPSQSKKPLQAPSFQYIFLNKMTGPETLLKRRRVVEDLRRQKQADNKQEIAYRRSLRDKMVKRAEAYAKQYRQKEQDVARIQREAKKSGNFYVPEEAKVALVIRIRGINAVCSNTRKILQLFRLRQIHNAVFVKLNKATQTMLRLVEPYIAYGYPTLKTVRDLIYKRGYAKINKQRLPITSNKIIEDNLGHLDIICMEDLVHEIVTCGPNFKEVNRFFFPFKLNPPRGGYPEKRRHFIEGGQYGNREEHINEFLARML